MLNSGKEARLWGFRFPTVFGALSVSGGIGATALVFTLIAASSLDSRRALLVPLAASVGFVFAVAIWAAYWYFAATKHLADVRTTSKAILESLVGGVLTFDNDARITIINRAAARILELPSHAPYPTIDTFASRHPAIAEGVQRALANEEYSQESDISFVNSAGKMAILRTTVSAQMNEDGDRVGLIVLVKDVSAIIALEQELRKRDRLAAAGSLAAGVAHEIRNPLSAIDLNLRLLRDEVAPALGGRQDVEEYFEILFVEIARLSRITDSFLQLSRADTLNKTKIHLREPVLRVVRLLEPEARDKGISFRIDLSPNEPAVLGDATKLEQVWLNILINAMQAMPKGGEIRVSEILQSDGDAEWISLVVEDQGIGVPAENIDRLFDPYFTTRINGSGLGLAIADRIVADHGGMIAVESLPAHGTKLTVRIPAASKASLRSAR